MNKQKFAQILQTNNFKRIMFLIGIVLLVLSGFITVKPEPFLKFGYLGVFIFNLFGPGTLLIPTLAQHMNIYLLATATALGMAFNDSIAWLIGSFGHDIIPHSKKAERIENGLRKYGTPALFFWSLIPIPYDIIGFIAGYLGFNYKSFVIPTFLGKFVRFVLMGYGVIKAVEYFK